jgi:hypothetical protein
VSGSLKIGFIDQMGDCQLLRKDSLGNVFRFIRAGLYLRLQCADE